MKKPSGQLKFALESIAKLEQKLAEKEKVIDYNVYLSTRFMGALFRISNSAKFPIEVPLNEWLPIIEKQIKIAKEALTTETYHSFNQPKKIKE